jgi:hypothetical protein
MTNRVGFPKDVKMYKKEKLERGTIKMATAEIGKFGKLTALSWQDTKPVHLLSTGLNTNPCTVSRCARGEREKKQVHAVNIVKKYQECMNGVDRHDYLRMATYSVQMSHVFRKWYITFFNAMIDLTLVNSFIIWKLLGHKSTHASFNETVSLGLLSTQIRRVRNPTSTKRGLNFANTRLIFEGHEMMRFEPYEGYNGREKRYRKCVVCQAFQQRFTRNITVKHAEFVCEREQEMEDKYTGIFSIKTVRFRNE